MSTKFKNGFLVLLNMIGVVAIVYFGSLLLYEIESIYEYIGDKIPILGRLFEWAESIFR